MRENEKLRLCTREIAEKYRELRKIIPKEYRGKQHYERRVFERASYLVLKDYFNAHKELFPTEKDKSFLRNISNQRSKLDCLKSLAWHFENQENDSEKGAQKCREGVFLVYDCCKIDNIPVMNLLFPMITPLGGTT